MCHAAYISRALSLDIFMNLNPSILIDQSIIAELL